MPPASHHPPASSPPAASPSRPAAVRGRPEPLSFSRWLARRAYAADLPLLLLELLLISALYRSQQLFRRMCLPVGGGPHAALQELPLEPAAHRADALLVAFPCRASYAGRLLYVLRTGAEVDPRVPLRLTDWGNAGYTLVRLLALAVALAAPWLYERTRHGLFFATTAATFLGAIASALWTPHPLLPLVASAFTLQRPSALYFSWRAVAMLRCHTTCHLSAVKAGVFFVAVAVLPYMVARVWEHLSLRPQYRAYLHRCDGGSGGVARRLATAGSSSHAPKEPLRWQQQQQPGSRTALSVPTTNAAPQSGAADDERGSAARRSRPRQRAAGHHGPERQRLHPISAVCVEGCVHLLLTLRWVEGGGEDGSEEGGSYGSSGAGGGAIVHHTILQQAAAAAADGIDGGAVSLAVRQLLADALSHNTPSCTKQRPHCAVVWPPAVALAAAEQDDGGADGSGGSIKASQQQLSTGGAEVLVLLPAALLRGQGAVRCVVAGPTGRQQGQKVHVDVTVDIAAGNLRPAEPRPGGGTGWSPRMMAGQPLVSLPLLVLPHAAAAEVRQLYGNPLGGGLQDALDGLLRAAAAAAADRGACARLLAGANEGAAAAPSAAAAIAASGLTGMVYDMGDLLQLPYYISRVTPPPPDDLLSFLASHGMPACLRAGLQALRCAGVQLAEEEEAALLAEAAARAGQPTAEGDAGLGRQGGAGTNGAAGSASCMEPGRGEAQRASAVRPAVCESPAGAQAEAYADAPAVGSGGRPMKQPLPIQPAGPLWWLRVLLLGFSPPGLERSYQAFKAAQCRSLDRLALVLLLVFRLLALMPNLQAVLSGT
ncbi:hypothetical protein TSOC_013381, partial [Tetrabaena socialis]